MAAGRVERSRVAVDRADRAARDRWLQLHDDGATREDRVDNRRESIRMHSAHVSRAEQLSMPPGSGRTCSIACLKKRDVSDSSEWMGTCSMPAMATSLDGSVGRRSSERGSGLKRRGNGRQY